MNTLFFDVGGVILTNGWDQDARRRAAEQFSLSYEELDFRHEPIFETFERGLISRDEYLDTVVFFKERDFSRQDFIRFMEAQSQPHESTFRVLEKLVQDGRYLLATINNESLELNQFRIKKFDLRKYFTAFFTSSFVRRRKPDTKIFETALHVLQKTPGDCLFIDDREENVHAAAKLGINAVHLTNVKLLKKRLLEKGVYAG